MDDKSRLKVGDLVRRANPCDDGDIPSGVGIVIAIDRRHRPIRPDYQIDVDDAWVKWMDTTRGGERGYAYQLQKVIKE